MNQQTCPRCGDFAAELGFGRICPSCEGSGQQLRDRVIARVRWLCFGLWLLAASLVGFAEFSLSPGSLSHNKDFRYVFVTCLFWGLGGGWATSLTSTPLLLRRAHARGVAVSLEPIDRISLRFGACVFVCGVLGSGAGWWVASEAQRSLAEKLDMLVVLGLGAMGVLGLPLGILSILGLEWTRCDDAAAAVALQSEAPRAGHDSPSLSLSLTVSDQESEGDAS